MPKFTVYAEKIVSYTVEMEAANEESAGEAVKTLLITASSQELANYQDSDDGFEIIEAVQHLTEAELHTGSEDLQK